MLLIDPEPRFAKLPVVAPTVAPPVIVTVFPLTTGAPAAPPLDIVPVTCANAGPAAKGATRAVEAMSCVRSTRLIRARVPVATVPVDVIRFTSLEIFILVPRYFCTSQLQPSGSIPALGPPAHCQARMSLAAFSQA